MDYIGLIGICAAAILPFAILKKYAPEQSLLLVLGVVALVVFRSISLAAPLFETLEELFLRSGIEKAYIEVLLRSVAAAVVTHLCAGLCRDGGSQAMASAVELTGAMAALLIAIPLLEAVADLMLEYFG